MYFITAVFWMVVGIGVLFLYAFLEDKFKSMKWSRRRKIENEGRPVLQEGFIREISVEYSFDSRSYSANVVNSDRYGENRKPDYSTCGYGDHPMDAVKDLINELNEKHEKKWDNIRKGRSNDT